MSDAAARRSAPVFVDHQPSPRGVLAAVLRLPIAVLDLMIDWQLQSEERASMSHLSDRQLRDIGVSAEMMRDMAGKLHWNR